jgi:tRNA(Ile)-lysidine synthase
LSDGNPVLDATRAALAPILAARAASAGDCPPLRVTVALSGGRDSMALLDAVATLVPEFPIRVSALHVHHGLSPHADAWASFCAAECDKRGIALAVRRVRVDRAPGESLEAQARAARFAALADADADIVALAHHADDQAETLLLQLLRGAGPHGLSAMSAARRTGGPLLVRPLLAVSGAAIEAYAQQHQIVWIDDESNADTRFKRNYLRHEIAPRLAAAFPGYPATLVRAAAHHAEAALLLDELAARDAGIAVEGAAPTLDRAAFVALALRAPHRARNLLRWFIRRHGLVLPSTARLAAMQDQLVRAAPDAKVRLAHAGAEIGIHRGRIAIHPPPVGHYAVRWEGERSLALPHGTLEFGFVPGAGLAAAAVAAAPVVVRPREGGERIRLAANRPRQPLKRLLQEAGVPAWQRDEWPLVWCGDALAAVPGIGIAADFQAPAGTDGYDLRWKPHVWRAAIA